MGSSRKFLVTATPPTTNGDLHVGHLAGPYLNADVFCRSQRQRGNTTLYISSGDDNQSYVVTTAQRLKTTAVQLAAECNEQIRETLALADIDMDEFTTPDEEHDMAVRAFVRGLYERGKLPERVYDFPYSQATGRFLFEAFASGYCPECFARTSGAICERCGHPNDVRSLLYAEATGSNGVPLESAQRKILVLPLESYRAQITDFYERRQQTMRPHVMRFVEEMLAAPLPDFPITYPDTWGIEPAIEGLDGQVINVWAEMLPGLYRTGNYALRDRSIDERHGIESPASGYELIQFLGYDNTFYFAFVHLCLAFASGEVITPTAITTNEFYHLDGSKFSTSRRHLIWARDLIGRYGSDNVRFYLALDNPEHQIANFTEAAFVDGVRKSLHAPLVAIAQGLEPFAGKSVQPIDGDTDAFARFESRMARAYDLETFSIRQGAETIANLLAMLADRATSARADGGAKVGVVVSGLRRLAREIWPLTPRLGAELCAMLGLGDPAAATAGGCGDAAAVVPELVLSRLIQAL